MTDHFIEAGQIVTTPITLWNNDTLTTASGGTLGVTDADALSVIGRAYIYNSGLISAESSTVPRGNVDGIDFGHSGNGVIYNYEDGIISGARHGITGDQPITIQNHGTIMGQAGAGINLDTAPTTVTSIYNFGTTVGHAVEGLKSGDGVDVDGLVYLSNHGLIQALGTRSDGTSEAVTVGGGTILNYADGIIFSDERAISVDGGEDRDAFAATWIHNEGTIESADHGAGAGEAIRIVGSFDDTIINHGLIRGSIHTGGGNDTVNNIHGSGDAVVFGDSGNDRLYGGNGHDRMSGGTENDQLDGGNGNDTLSGGDDHDVLYGDADDDVLNGGEGNDHLNGDDGIDTLIGGNGNDMLFGGSNTDWSFGEAGDDFLVLDRGDDYLGGGADHDRFSFRPHPSYAAGFGHDVIYDFTQGEDRIEISGVSTYSSHWVAAEDDGRVDDLRLDFPTAEASSLTLINAGPIVENVDLFFV